MAIHILHRRGDTSCSIVKPMAIHILHRRGDTSTQIPNPFGVKRK